MKNPLIPNYRRPPRFIMGHPAPQALECGGEVPTKLPLSLPTVALSIRQPWAWLIVNGQKDIENRTRNICNFLGPVLIHAGQSCDPTDDYYTCLQFLRARGLGAIINVLPTLPDLERGGIVGLATINGHGNFEMKSPWWVGPYSYCLVDARPLPFQPCKGRLGFFDCVYKIGGIR